MPFQGKQVRGASVPPENPPLKLMPCQFWAAYRRYCLGFVLAGGFVFPPLVLISAK
jgi:hypothetical protein